MLKNDYSMYTSTKNGLYVSLTYSTIVYIIPLIMITMLVSLTVVLLGLLVMDGMMSMSTMRRYSRQAAIVTERRKKRKLP